MSVGLTKVEFRAEFECLSAQKFGAILGCANTAALDTGVPPKLAESPYRDVYVHVCAVPSQPSGA